MDGWMDAGWMRGGRTRGAESTWATVPRCLLRTGDLVCWATSSTQCANVNACLLACLLACRVARGEMGVWSAVARETAWSSFEQLPVQHIYMYRDELQQVGGWL